MTEGFRNLSIRAKLILLMMGISGAVLFLAVVSLLVIEFFAEREEVEAEIASLAKIIGTNSRAALVFGDEAAARELLDALQLNSEIVGAWLQNNDGEVLAHYSRTGRKSVHFSPGVPPVPARMGELLGSGAEAGRKFRLGKGALLILQPIILDGEQVGTLFLQADLGKLDARIAAFMSAGALILFLSGLVSFLLASWLQRLISQPVAALTGLMDQVARKQDYSLRLESRSRDEVGLLVEGFNAMLAQVELREEELAKINRSLESRVAERTHALAGANSELIHLLQEYRQAETVLRQQAQVLEQIHDSVIMTDVAGYVISWNKGSERCFGFSAAEAMGQHISFLYDPADHEFLQQQLIVPLLQKGEHESEVKLRKKSGEFIWGHLSLSLLRDLAGNVTALVGYSLDISARRLAENALRESEANYRALFENSPISLWREDFSRLPGYFAELRAAGVVDFADYFVQHPEEILHCAKLTRILDVNQKTIELFGAVSKDDFLGNLERIFNEKSFSAFREILVALAEGRSIFETEGCNRTMDGGERCFLIRYSIMPSALTSLDSVIISLVDITERREAEEALRILGKALETTRVGVTIANMDGEIVFTNSAEASMHGYEIGELLGEKVNILGPPALRSEFPGGGMQTGQRESLNLRKDGSVFPVQLFSDLVVDPTGNPLAVVTVCEDITERKTVEARLKDSVAEKDVLLKEIHHRVKNNLQIMSSLLNLQMAKITDAYTLDELKATRNRIRSMALIHERLYQSENLSQVNFAEYVDVFSRHLRSLCNVDPGKIEILLDIDAADLHVDMAIPCGMIVSELLTNALKYAFPMERHGIIKVVLRSEPAERVLIVEDNGVGLPPTIDLSTANTLGLQLVRGLAKQIGATVSIERGSGTRVVVRCPVAGHGIQSVR